MTPSDIEPGWFYSSLAQSSATIVALFGGLLANRIGTHAERLRDVKLDIEIRINSWRTYFQNRIEMMKLFRSQLADAVRTCEDPAVQATTNCQVTFSTTWTSSGGSFGIVVNPRQFTEFGLMNLRVLDSYISYLPTPKGAIEVACIGRSLSDISNLSKSFTPANNDFGLRDPRGLFEGDISILRELAMRTKSYNGNAVPGYTSLAFSMLFILSVSGIIWPLYVMPVDDTWIKIVMLLLVSYGMYGLGWYLYALVSELKTSCSFTWDVDLPNRN